MAGGSSRPQTPKAEKPQPVPQEDSISSVQSQQEAAKRAKKRDGIRSHSLVEGHSTDTGSPASRRSRYIQ